MKTQLGFVLTLCLVASLGAEPVDGFYWPAGWYHHLNTFQSEKRYWEGNAMPADGGEAYFTGTQAGDISFDSGSTVTLRGLDFGNVQRVNGSGANRPRILTTGLVLTGDDAFICGTGWGSNTSGQGYYLDVNATVSGTGANTLTVKGPGSITVNTPFANFGTLVAGGGDIISAATSGRLFATGGTTALRGGIIRWAPSLKSGGTAAATLGAVTYGSGHNVLKWWQGSGSEIELTIDSLTSEGAGSTLWVRPSGGATSLGIFERLMVTTPPALVNGILDPGVVTRNEVTESWPLSFTTYHSAKGVIPYPASSMVELENATATDVAVLSASNTLETSKQVAALVVDNSSLLSISNGVTLTVGDGNAAHQAGVIFNRQVPLGTNVSLEFAGDGTLDFGASPGVIWLSSPTMDGWGKNRITEIKTKITGQNGVTFASHGRDVSTSVGIFNILSGYCNWTGPTRVSGAVLWVKAQDALPAGDIYVIDGDSGWGGQFRFDGAWTLNQNFYLSGLGAQGDGGAVYVPASGLVTLKGVVTLVGDASFASPTAGAGGVLFRNEVRGPGRLLFPNGGTYHFYATNSFSGLDISGATTVNVVEGGTLGTGRVWLRGNYKRNFNFSEVQGLAVTNEFRTAGTVGMSLTHSKISIEKDLTMDSLAFTNFSELAIGGNFSVGTLKATGSRNNTHGTEQVKACAAGATLGIGNAADAVLGVPLSDGTGTLGLTKKGTGTVELPLVSRTYTGPTTVAAGTLKLNDNPLLSKSLLYWMDASCEADFEKDATTGAITKWHSHGGKAGYYFAPSSGTSTWGTAAKVNGLDVVTTGSPSASRLRGSAALEHRTVFVVYRMANAAHSFSGIFGSHDLNSGDYGVRLNGNTPSTSTYWDTNRSHYNYNTTGTVRYDGGPTGRADEGNPHILTLVHDCDNWVPSVSWGQNTLGCRFTPDLGWYQGTTRYYEGDYCEVLAFDRVLTESEMRVVENYLSKKWLNRTIWADEQKPALLPSGTALTVETGATLDLAGCSATVASLAGNGTITNSSDKAATLTVTGGGSFTGHLGGKTTLAMGADAAAGAVVTEGATLAATGGSLATGTHALTPPTNGLAYWCDAGLRDTILLDSSNAVTGWVSRVASSSSMLVSTGGSMPNSSTRSKPTYSANALGGKPCISFAGGLNALWSIAKTPVRTMFVVVAANGAQTGNCAGIWGVAGKDRGFRFSNNSTSVEGGGGGVRFTGPGDWVTLDGVAKGTSGFDLGNGTVRVIGARMDSAHHTDAYFTDELGLGANGASRVTNLGNYSGNPSFVGFVGEVIAYDRELSDNEMKQVENYLVAKWKDASWTEGNPPEESEPGFAGGALSVASGASATVADGTSVSVLSGGGSLTGNVTADGFDVTVKPDGTTDTLTVDGTVTLDSTAYLHVNDAQNLQNGVFGTFLQATDIVGTFAGSNLEKPNTWSVTRTNARVFCSSGTVLIFR